MNELQIIQAIMVAFLLLPIPITALCLYTHNKKHQAQKQQKRDKYR